MKLAGCSAVVTGGASGLGEATARALAAEGVKVAIFDMNAEKGEKVAADIGGVFCNVNVTSDESVEAGFAKARAANGQERILINCAGTGNAAKTASRAKETGEIRHFPLDAFNMIIQINLVGTFRCIAKSAAGMVTLEPMADGERGLIINTASVAAQDGQIGQAAYSASKGGVDAALGGRIGRLADLAVLGRHRGGVDDQAALAVLHRLQRHHPGRRLRQHAEGAEQVDPHGAFELRHVVGPDLAGVLLARDRLLARGDAGAVDGEALLTVRGAGLFEAGGDAGGVGHVHMAEDAAQLFGDDLTPLDVHVEQGDFRARGRDGARRALAQARGPARHHRRDRTVEFHGRSPYVCREPENVAGI